MPDQITQSASPQGASADETRFVLQLPAELPTELLQRRPEHVQRLLKVAMMGGLQMDLCATLTLICNLAREMVPFDTGLVYFWNEVTEQSQLRSVCGALNGAREKIANGNVLNFWSIKHGGALMLAPGEHPEADELLELCGARSALAVPLLLNSRPMGSLQLFAAAEKAFKEEDAQLISALAHIAENLLAREYKNEGLLQFAFTDHLTALRTRGFFEQQLELEIKRFERSQQPFTLLMLDIDFFKALNDHYGHRVGDKVLREVAKLLTQDMREIDTCARYGGEEFAIILPDTNEQEAMAVAERIRAAVEAGEFTVNAPKSGDRISISIGLAVFDRDAKKKRELIERADAALYFAKSQGRNRVVAYRDYLRLKKAG